jgi:hypothetical protein
MSRQGPDQLSEIDNLIRKAMGQEPPLATARQKSEHPARLVLNGAVDPMRKAFLLRAVDNEIEDTIGLVVRAQHGPGCLEPGGQWLQLPFHDGAIEGWRPPDGLGGVGNDHVQVGLVPPELPRPLLDGGQVAQVHAPWLQTIRPGGSVRLGREAPGGVVGTKTTARSPVLK